MKLYHQIDFENNNDNNKNVKNYGCKSEIEFLKTLVNTQSSDTEL